MRLIQIAAIVCVLVVVAACSPAQPAAAVQNAAVLRPTLDPANEGLVARVNGVGIPTMVYLRELDRRMAASNAANDAALAQEVLDTLIDQELINQGAEALGLTVTDADVELELDNLRSMTDDWPGWMAANGFTEEEMVKAQRDTLLTQRVQMRLLSAYEEPVLQVHARHIVVPTSAQAADVLDRLNNGEGFAELAAAFSLDSTSRSSGGDLGWFARNELFYPNLEEVAFGLEPGQIAGPVSTSLGYHIIQTLDKAARPVEPERLPMLAENLFNNWLAEQYRKATIERYI